jgi:hypothetical protein
MVCRYHGVFDAAAMVCLCGFWMECVGVLNIEKRCDSVSGEWQWFSYIINVRTIHVYFFYLSGGQAPPNNLQMK